MFLKNKKKNNIPYRSMTPTVDDILDEILDPNHQPDINYNKKMLKQVTKDNKSGLNLEFDDIEDLVDIVGDVIEGIIE